MALPGTLHITTELGRMDAPPGHICVVPCGMRFSVDLREQESAHGYVLEVYGHHFELPALGAIGGHRPRADEPHRAAARGGRPAAEVLGSQGSEPHWELLEPTWGAGGRGERPGQPARLPDARGLDRAPPQRGVHPHPQAWRRPVPGAASLLQTLLSTGSWQPQRPTTRKLLKGSLPSMATRARRPAPTAAAGPAGSQPL